MMDSSQWRLEEERALRGYSVEWAEPGCLILARRNDLYTAPALGERPRLLGGLATSTWKTHASRLRLVQRMLRFSFYNVVRLADGKLFYTFGRSVGIWDGAQFRPLPGLVRPTRVLRGACAQDRDGSLFFGEYISNPERHEIHVYRYAPGAAALEIVHTFGAGSVRHVHGIYADPYSSSLWCVTGDRQSECRMLSTSDQFRTLETVGQGDETWRCVSLLFTQRGAYYGSDAEFIQNHLFFVDRATGARETLSAIDGPVYYSHALGPDLFFGVTAELCPSQQGKHASLWHVRDGARGQRVLSIAKDSWPVRFFQPGTWQFAHGPGLADRLLVHLVALSKSDNRTFALRQSGGDGELP